MPHLRSFHNFIFTNSYIWSDEVISLHVSNCFTRFSRLKFHKCPHIREIRENIVPRKILRVRYNGLCTKATDISALASIQGKISWLYA